MGFFDYFSDVYAALSIPAAEAEEQQFSGPTDKSGEQTSGKDHTSGGIGSAQHDRGAKVGGGASSKPTPAAGPTGESDDEADANAKDAKKDDGPASSADDGDDEEADSEEGGDDEAGDDEEEEEEEEEEPEDIKPKLEEECLKTPSCAPLKHHYDECVERVTHQQEQNGKAEEDCVEEFFHMMHCATQCAAPKLFKALR